MTAVPPSSPFEPLNPLKQQGEVSPLTDLPYISPSKVRDQLLEKVEDPQKKRASSHADFPNLTAPEPSSSTISFSDFLRSISEALSASKKQLSAAQTTQSVSSMRSNEAILDQAQSLTSLIDSRKSALEAVKSSTEEALSSLNSLSQKIQEQMEALQAQIDKINQGNSEEVKAFKDLISAYETYVAQLESIGVKDQGDGTYYVPEDSVEQYNAYTEEFQKSLETFNTYWSGRKEELEDFNASVESYNQEAASNNQALENFCQTYNLPPLPGQPFATPVQIPEVDSPLPAPETLTSGPAIVKIPPLPSSIGDVAKSGLSDLPSLGTYPAIDMDTIGKEIFTTLYEQNVSYYDDRINASINTLSTSQAVNSAQAEDTTSLMNEKPLYETLFKKFFSNAERINSFDIDPKTLSRLENDQRTLLTKNAEVLLSKDLLQKEIKEALPLLEEEEIEPIVQQLETLSFVMLQNQGLRALYPGLSVLSTHLESLPIDHPAFALTYALSFVNRTKEELLLGLSGEKIESYIKTIPALKALLPEQIEGIKGHINFSLTQASLKLLEANLGLPGLVTQLIKQSDPPKKWLEKIDEALHERDHFKNELRSRLYEHFLVEKFGKGESAFLGKVGARLIDLKLSPNVGSLSTKSIDLPLLDDSFTAALLLIAKPTLSLQEAATIAKEGIKDLPLDQPQFSTLSQLRGHLAGYLSEIGFKEEAPVIVKNILLVPPEIDLEAAPALSLPELKEVVSKRVSELLPRPIAETFTPHLLFSLFGGQPVKETEEIALTIERVIPSPSPTFSDTLPRTSQAAKTINRPANDEPIQSSPIDDEIPKAKPLPAEEALLQNLFSRRSALEAIRVDKGETLTLPRIFSATEILKSRFDSLKVLKDETFANKQFEAFKETIRSSEDLAYFLEQLMNPANAFIYSAFSGIIYPSISKNQQLMI